MRIMIFSNSEWDDTNASGNTLSNFFSRLNWKNDEFFNIYIRSSRPNNNICKNYYQLLLTDIIKHYFCKELIGNSFIYEANNKENKNNGIINEKKIINFIHKYSLNFVYLIADHLYRSKKWINKKFEQFVKKANPNIFYAHVNNFPILCPIIEYLKKNTNAKIVLLLTDDLYNDINKKSVFRRNKLKSEFINIINMADKLYAISSELGLEYSKIFNKKIDILYKGCIFDYPVKKNINNIVKFVYAGNLLYGRDETLSKIGHAIEKNNSCNSQKAILEIYTNATVTESLKSKLNLEKSSIIKGKRNYDEIKKIMNNAEYNLQVESFEKKQIDYVKYSFSTKIIDCLQSGSSSLAVGPNCVSSIKYMKKIPGVYVIDNLNKIEEEIKKLINNKNQILENAIITRNYALKNHDINNNQKKLRRAFINLMEEKR